MVDELSIADPVSDVRKTGEQYKEEADHPPHDSVEGDSHTAQFVAKFALVEHHLRLLARVYDDGVDVLGVLDCRTTLDELLRGKHGVVDPANESVHLLDRVADPELSTVGD